MPGQKSGFSQAPGSEQLDLPANHPDARGSLTIVCGPVLRYWGMDKNVWRGSVLYVTKDVASSYAQFPQFEVHDGTTSGTIKPYKVFEVLGHTFWRFDIDVPMGKEQKAVGYQLGQEHPAYRFFVPGVNDNMHIMFYSCNGFSLSTDTAPFKGTLWKDVLRKHNERPFNVMLGGGDQIYCDSITAFLPAFKKWTKKNITRRGFEYMPNEQDKDSFEVFYFKQYTNWFGRGYWKGSQGETTQSDWVTALATIPMLNIYDDHDVLDGWGSYKDKTMSTPMMEALGYSAFRYYLLFQQCINPEPESMDPKTQDPSWVTTGKKGKFLHRPALSIYARLGKNVAFYGLDCRTERTAHTVCEPSSYDAMFNRLDKEFTADKNIKHVLVMLGVPIAYPRMVWAERMMASGLIKPIKWLARRGIMFKGFVNQFDGQVELLDDLNDHWCAENHKRERNHFVYRLQELAKRSSVRVTILAGDVHLCAVGRFLTKGNAIPAEQDWRYMVCPISSAIVNTPPPQLLADFMNKRNHLHYLESTMENMMPIFKKDVDGASINNHCTLARRNYCMLDLDEKQPVPSLLMSLQVEKNSEDVDSITVPYVDEIPALVVKSTSS